MKIIKRTDERAKKVEAALEANGGYCPCKTEKSDYTKCMCREFKISAYLDSEWYGVCHCGLYEKEKD